MLSSVKQMLKQLFSKPATNNFPTKRVPRNASAFITDLSKGKAKFNPPISVPERFRGRLKYEKDRCIKCKQCIKVCPAAALEFDEKLNAIVHYAARCTFCGQCVDICPVKCLEQTQDFLISTYDKKIGFMENQKKKNKKKES
ncbi:MAG: 4Fe-4S binding protein [Candidatus Diapherotrites archaeon]|nr:4Fe-4S binding protein [Candidatus Diapherotrites archaeon]